MATKKKNAAKTQPKRRPRSGKKTPRIDLVVDGIERVLGNRITQLNADMHAEIGSIKSSNGKTDRLMAQNAQEFQELRGLVKRLQDYQDGTQSVLNHVDTRLRVLEQAAKAETKPPDVDPFRDPFCDVRQSGRKTEQEDPDMYNDKQDGPYPVGDVDRVAFHFRQLQRVLLRLGVSV